MSLVRLIRGESAPRSRLFFAEFGGREVRWAKAVWDDRCRLVVSNMGKRPRKFLYDRLLDPAETRNLAAELPDERDRLAREIEVRFPPGRRIRSHSIANPEPVAPEVSRRLRALGYEE